MKLKAFLKQMIDIDASDVFIVPGLPLSYEIGGVQHRMGEERLTPADTEDFIRGMYDLANRNIALFTENINHDDDFSLAVSGIGRFRANVFRQRGTYGCILRVIPFGLPDAEHYEIPEEVLCCADYRKGLVLVTGPAGVGKSTTLACMVDRLNHRRHSHIITLEDPIEHVHSHGTCIVTQREIPTDIASYPEALRSAMRESPDILLVGEMRDMETIETAIKAAEMSQLLFSTLHTNGAAASIERIVDSFPASRQHQIRVQLSLTLQAVISQQLIPTIEGKVTPAFEIMHCNTAIRSLIRENKTHQIDSVIASSGNEGMVTMDQSLFKLLKEGRIDKETAMQYSTHKEALETRIANDPELKNHEASKHGQHSKQDEQ